MSGQSLAYDEIVFKHNKVLNVYFNKTNPNILIAENPNTIDKARVYFPPNKWIMLTIINYRAKIQVTLRNSTGNLISSTNVTFIQPTDPVARNVTILDRFNGKCLGIKYYKGSVPMFPDFHYFWDLPQTIVSETALIAVYFNKTGMVTGSKT